MPKRLFDRLTLLGRARLDVTITTGPVRPPQRRYAVKPQPSLTGPPPGEAQPSEPESEARRADDPEERPDPRPAPPQPSLTGRQAVTWETFNDRWRSA